MSHNPLQSTPRLSDIFSLIEARGKEQYLSMQRTEQRRVEDKELKVPYQGYSVTVKH